MASARCGRSRFEKALREAFRPEFLNRVDEIIVFEPLTESELSQIVDLMLKEVANRLSDRKVEVEVTEAARAELVKEGYDRMYGARPLRRTIQRRIENALAKRILAGEFQESDVIRVDFDGQDFRFEKAGTPRAGSGAGARGGVTPALWSADGADLRIRPFLLLTSARFSASGGIHNRPFP